MDFSNLDIGLTDAILSSVELFSLVFIRMSGMLIVSPIFGRRNLPAYYKTGFAFFLALIVTSSNTIVMPQSSGTALEYAFFCLRELVVGLSIGFIPFLMFSAIYLAGQLIDMQIGFSMVSVLDPVSNLQIPVTSNFYFILCMLVFISVNAHHSMINLVCRSYSTIPLGHITVDGDLVRTLIRLFSDIFTTGFQIAAPIIFTVLLTDVSLGIISKAMPQINIFMVGMPLKILVGLIIIVVTMPALMVVLGELFKDVEAETYNFMRGLGS